VYHSTHRRILSGLRNGSALAAALVFSCSAAIAASTLPKDGQYVAGSGAIAQKSNGLTINQSSTTGIINWSSFSVGKGQTVRFNNGGGATLNRVTGGNLSTISGALRSSGSVYLINPQGVIVSKTGRVTTQGDFIASSRDLTDDDFRNGKRHFSGSAQGDVSNAGHIVSANGDVALIGRSVANSGSLSAANGRASMNAGDDVLLAPKGSSARILVSGGSGDVSNTGIVQAAQAQLNAAGGNVYALAGNNGGIIRATGTQTINGHVWLTSRSGDVHADGRIAAHNADGSGGRVDMRGENIALPGRVDVSATAAAQTGGHVTAVAKDTTEVSGIVAAKGGVGGKGGFVETSGAHVHVADSTRITTLTTGGATGRWLIDPNDFTIAASGGDITGATLSSELGSNDVTIQSSDGAQADNGDIFVNDAVSWSSDHALTLTAVRNIEINQDITASGASAGLILNFGGDYFIDNAAVTLSGASASLAINSTAYTLIHNMTDLQAINTGLGGNYALAQSLDATSVSNWQPLGTVSTLGSGGTGFTGDFTGLGNTISNLSIVRTGDWDGLFGYSSGVIRDLHLSNLYIDGSGAGGIVGINTGRIDNVSVEGRVVGSADETQDVGGIAAINYGTISNASVSGTAAGWKYIGGLVGYNESTGVISNSHVDGGASGTPDTENNGAEYIGGLVGQNDGTIGDSYVTGNVGATNGDVFWVGGLVGQNTGSIANSYSTASVISYHNFAGGLVGLNTGTVTQSYATGAVIGAANIGGLVGANEGGSISQSYATGNVEARKSGGGLVGYNSAGISNSYATGSVTSTSTTGQYFGGLVGLNGGRINRAYSIGQVNASYNTGGFVGFNNANGSLIRTYWDTQTSGTNKGIGNGTLGGDLTGRTTAQLQAVLPAGFSSSIWGTGPSLFPYFQWQYPTTPKAVSGKAYSNAGVSPLKNATVYLLVDGSKYGTFTTGADGYYYFVVPTDVIQSNAQVLTYLPGAGGIALAQDANATISNLDIYGGALSATTAASTYSGFNSALSTNLADAIGSYASVRTLVDALPNLAIHATAPRFTIDTTVNQSGGILELFSSGRIEESDTGSIRANTLLGSADGPVVLDGNNVIGSVNTFSTGSANNAFILVDNNDLAFTGALNASAGTISIKTIGSGHDISVEGTLTGGIVSLISAGTIIEDTSNGKIDATTFQGSSYGVASLASANNVTNLKTFTTANGNFTFKNGKALNVTGTVSAAKSNAVLALITNTGDLSISGKVSSANLTLRTGAEATETSTGSITTDLLKVVAKTGIDLDSSRNDIKQIGVRHTDSGPDVIQQ